MSYHSQVSIALSVEGYKKLKELFKNLNTDKEFILKNADSIYTNPNGLIIFCFDDYNWWGIDESSILIMDLLENIHSSGYGYNFLRIGENIDDIEYLFIDGNSEDEQFYVLSCIQKVDILDDSFSVIENHLEII